MSDPRIHWCRKEYLGVNRWMENDFQLFEAAATAQKLRA